MLKSMFLSSVRPFYGPADKPDATGGGDDQEVDANEGDDEEVEGKPTVLAEEDLNGTDDGEEIAKAEGTEEEEVVVEEPAVREDWRDKELRRKHAKLQESQRKEAEANARAEAAERLLERTGKKSGEETEEETPKTYTQEDIKRAAAVQIAQERYNEDCNTAAKTGQKEYKETWKKAMDNLQTLGGFDPETMQQILSTDNPAQVLHTLGTDPEKYQTIMDLPPAKRFAELVKTGMPVKKVAKGISRAAAPVNGVRTRAPEDTSLGDEVKDDGEWQRRRHADRAKRFAARSGSKAPSYS